MGRQLSDDLESDVQDCFFNTSHFGGEYTYTPPRSGSPTSITGVWRIDDVPNLEVTRGLENVLTGKLRVDDAETIKKDGSFSINGETWQVESVGGENVGTRTIVLTRQVTSHRGNGDNFR